MVFRKFIVAAVVAGFLAGPAIAYAQSTKLKFKTDPNICSIEFSNKGNGTDLLRVSIITHGLDRRGRDRDVLQMYYETSSFLPEFEYANLPQNNTLRAEIKKTYKGTFIGGLGYYRPDGSFAKGYPLYAEHFEDEKGKSALFILTLAGNFSPKSIVESFAGHSSMRLVHNGKTFADFNFDYRTDDRVRMDACVENLQPRQ